MKYIYIVCHLAIIMPAFAETAQPIEQTQSETTTASTEPKTLRADTLFFSTIYGGLSGYLCRTFERHVLGDLTVLRLLNLALWASLERSIIEDYIKDLESRNITHSPVAVINSARIISWLCYLLA